MAQGLRPQGLSSSRARKAKACGCPSSCLIGKTQRNGGLVVGVMGYELVESALQQQGVDTFFSSGARPCRTAAKAAIDRGDPASRCATSRLPLEAHALAASEPSRVCMTARPRYMNFAPASPPPLWTVCPWSLWAAARTIGEYSRRNFRNSTSSMRCVPVTWADGSKRPGAFPEMRTTRHVRAGLSGKPGPVYLDCPSDVLYASRRGRGGVAGRSPGRTPQPPPAVIA